MDTGEVRFELQRYLLMELVERYVKKKKFLVKCNSAERKDDVEYKKAHSKQCQAEPGTLS